MEAFGRIEIDRRADGSTVLTRRGVNPKAIERCYYGSLVLLAGLGLSRSFMDDAGLVAFVMFTAGMLPTVLDLPG